MRSMLALAAATTMVAAVPSDPKAAAAAMIKKMVSGWRAILAPFFGGV